jgi:hypothetical protein
MEFCHTKYFPLLAFSLLLHLAGFSSYWFGRRLLALAFLLNSLEKVMVMAQCLKTPGSVQCILLTNESTHDPLDVNGVVFFYAALFYLSPRSRCPVLLITENIFKASNEL